QDTETAAVDLFFLGWSPDGKTYAVQKHFPERDELWLERFLLDRRVQIAEGEWGVASLAGLPAPAVDFHWSVGTGYYLLAIPMGEGKALYLGQGDTILGLVLRLQEKSTAISWTPHRPQFLYVQGGKLFWQDLIADGSQGKPLPLTWEPVQLLPQSFDQIACPTWSPTGNAIALAAKREKGFDIYLYTPRNGKEAVVSRLTHLSPPSPPCPVWSPDGKRLAFYAPSRDRWRLYLLSADRPASIQMVSDRVVFSPQGPLWVGDDRLLYVGEGGEGRRAIYQLDLPTSPGEKAGVSLLLQPQAPLSPLLYWSPANRMLAYQIHTPQGMRIRFLSLPEKGSPPLAEPERAEALKR
ncbi:MAG: hypothetical protein D6736_13410, partial [Nitrospinota bacterium]